MSQKYAVIFVKLTYFQDSTFFLKKFEGILSITVGQNLVSNFLREIFSENKYIACSKVNSMQEACAKCFAVHILKFEILQITWKKMKQRTSDS